MEPDLIAVNPAARIWGCALGCCTVAALACCMMSGTGIPLIIFFIVAIASLMSLAGFAGLFALMRLLRLSGTLVWICTLTGVPMIVLANAWMLVAAFDSHHVTKTLSQMAPITLIPVAGSLIGIAAARKHISAFGTPDHLATTGQPSNPVSN